MPGLHYSRVCVCRAAHAALGCHMVTCQGLVHAALPLHPRWKGNCTPTTVPLRRCAHLTPRQILYLTKELASIAKQEAGQSMLHILVAAFTDLRQALPAEPPLPIIPPASGVSPANPASATSLALAASQITRTADAVGGRTRGGHRRVPSVQEQQAESRHLLRQQETLLGEARHAGMRDTREKLPAFSKRRELLMQLSQRSVMVISGATGALGCVAPPCCVKLFDYGNLAVFSERTGDPLLCLRS